MFLSLSKVLNYFSGSSDRQDPKSLEGETVDYYRKRGLISFLNKDYGLIDGKLTFFYKTSETGVKLSVGDTVTYLSYKEKKDNSERVLHVREYADFNSFKSIKDQDCLEKRSVPRASLKEVTLLIAKGCTKVVNGIVTKKSGRKVFISPLNINCDLDSLQCEFVPMEGDWVSATVEITENPFDSSQVVRVLKMEPIVIRFGIGSVTLAKENGEGIIENEIFFPSHVCPTEFKPTVGCDVKFSAIESVQGRCKWRALSVHSPPPSEDITEEKKYVTRYKNGLMVRGQFQFGPMNLEDKEELMMEIRNNGKSDRVLSHCAFTSSLCSSQIQLEDPEEYEDIILKSGQSKRLTFSCTAKFLGVSTEVFELYFKGFKMEFVFSVNVTLTNEEKAMLPDEIRKDPQQKKNTYLYKNFDYSNAFYGMKVAPRTRYTASNMANKQSNYVLPEDLFKIILGDPEMCKTRKHCHIVESVLKHYPQLEDELNPDNYKERFHTLLYFEEIEDRIMYRKFDLHNVILGRRENFLTLSIPRLVEDKIVLGIGTQVILTQPWSKNSTGKQVGYIHEFRDHELLISFHESFERSYDETACDIMFQPSRTTYIRSHTAIDMAVANLGLQWLFPKELVECPPVMVLSDEDGHYDNYADWSEKIVDSESNVEDYPLDDKGLTGSKKNKKKAKTQKNQIRWHNKNLNAEQKSAIKNILEGRGRSVPYIIQGPPGTGKTVTVIELVLQLYHMVPNSRVIIATPSNSAADLICQKLINAGGFVPGQVIRLLSFGRLMAGNYPQDIGPYCTSTQEDMQTIQPRGGSKYRYLNINEFLGSERVVIGTCCTLSILHDYGLKEGHFTHVIIDEAAQSTEPESLIPINFLNGKGQVILTGDTEQLGPISINFLSVRFGFSRSFMERIHNMPPYQKKENKFWESDGFDPRCVTRLKCNYRSVPEILRLPNELFYNSELIPVVSSWIERAEDIKCKFHKVLGGLCKSSALIFHGLSSVNFQEDNNYSWYNPHELWQTVCYLKKLYSLELSPDDIGVITPYQKQVEKIRYVLNGLRMPMPKIGSVEEFQGQERMVIILSTVRSSIKKIGTKESLIGFLSSPRRLNVAITRARALLIIVGNPYTLCIDRYWLEVIKYCARNSFYIGCPLDELFEAGELNDAS